MPLMFSNDSYHGDPEKVFRLLLRNPKKESKEFKEKTCRTVGPESLLYVNQREFAVVTPDDGKISILGSEDATTCHIVVLRHTGSGVTGLAHCDGCGMKQGMEEMLTKVKLLSKGAPDGRLELHLFCGFKDERHESVKISLELLSFFLNLGDEIRLETCCITDLNTIYKDGVPFPAVYGIGVETKTGSIFPAAFPEKGPDMSIRSACHFGDFKKMMNIYDNSTRHLLVGPFTWNPWDGAADWASVPDPFIRRYLSTSPAQEPEGFESSVRSALCTLRDNPDPSKSLFPEGLARRYQLSSNGEWRAVKP